MFFFGVDAGQPIETAFERPGDQRKKISPAFENVGHESAKRPSRPQNQRQNQEYFNPAHESQYL